MPKWIHDRADHIRSKNPDMPKSEAFAIATQQSHALNKSPKNYGTTQGKHTAKNKYKTPGDDVKTASFLAFSDELKKIAEGGTFWGGAKHDLGAAAGSIVGAGLGEKYFGGRPLEGSVVGAALGTMGQMGVEEALRRLHGH